MVWLIVGFYLLLGIMVRVPMIQSAIGNGVADAVSRKLGTSVSIGRVDVSLLNRIIIDDVAILDQQGKRMLLASRLSAKISLTELIQGRVSITSAQIFTPKLNLYKATATSKPNFQFVIDSLASKDTTAKAPLTVAINSLVIRRGQAEWNQLDAPKKRAFDTHHIAVSDISSHIIINTIGGDSLNVIVKRLSMKEASGLALSSLSLKAEGGKSGYTVKDLSLTLPHSAVSIPVASVAKGLGEKALLSYRCRLAESHVMLSDLAAFQPSLKDMEQQVIMEADVAGSDKAVVINSLEAVMPHSLKAGIRDKAASMRLVANGRVGLPFKTSFWQVNVRQLSVNADGMELLAGKLPEMVQRCKELSFVGKADGYGQDFNIGGRLVSGAGTATLAASKAKDNLKGHVKTDDFNLGQLLDDARFGSFSADVFCEGNIKDKRYSVKGSVPRFDYNKYTYTNMSVDGRYTNGLIDGKFSIADPNLTADITGSVDTDPRKTAVKARADISSLSPSKLNLAKGRLAEANYHARIDADFDGNSLNSAAGRLAIHDFSMKSSSADYSLDSVRLTAGHSPRGHYLAMESDFGHAIVYGQFDYASLPQSVENIIVKKLPSIVNLAPFTYKPIHTGQFSLEAYITNSDWAMPFFNVPLEIREPLTVSASVKHDDTAIQATVYATDIVYGDYHLKDIRATAKTEDDILSVDASLRNMRSESLGTDIGLTANAGNDNLMASLSIDNHARTQRLRGTVKGGIAFSRNRSGASQALLSLEKSNFHIGDTLYTIKPSNVLYSRKNLAVNGLEISSSSQSIRLDGRASLSENDSLTATLSNVDVSYILNLVNFHSVDFDGAVSGTASVKNLFGKPDAHGALRVDNFKLIGGRLGTLNALVDWNQDKGQIDIDAVANDTMMTDKGTVLPRRTFVNGYVSPERNYIDLAMRLSESRTEFVGDLCSSFLDDVDLSGNGNLRLWGDLKAINLTGDVTAHGSVRVTPLGTHYTLPQGKIHFTETDIVFQQDSVYDRDGHLGIISGAVHHRHLGHLTYDIDVNARNLLAFDLDGSDGSSFYGTVYGTGTATIKGRPGEVTIDVAMTPEKNSEVVYDISSPEELSSQEFIHWESRDSLAVKPNGFGGIGFAQGDGSGDGSSQGETAAPPSIDIPTDIRLSLSINATPQATLRIITDKQSGDYITLNGNGDLRATYYNKGGINVFGTYTIDHGIYSLTIQNIIKKTFEFAQGGTITFGGDPYSALLNLKAQYPIASVSLADLQVGRSFSSNNIRVICLMDITGTPAAPKVDFNLDFPTMSTDAKQMVYSLINGEEEMNQQVLYLLAVGRFYSKGVNNAGAQSNQTSLAMQSIVSGQLSQQINNVLSNVMKTSNWNFGANISTGDEGFNNAEYEGLLSGHLLNNRLLFNGQFGYRDNANATTSFIGDFDLRYLIFPNGNFSIHVYNQANDRYFTRNSLNTQGIGFILKKDFGSLRDLLGLDSSRKRLNSETKEPKASKKRLDAKKTGEKKSK